MEPLRVFIGYDEREALAYAVLAHSILRRATGPVSITPVARHQVAGVYVRPREENESTDFSLTRFLVPHLSDYTGWSVFMDCDMLCLTDITTIWQEIESQRDKAVLVCQHDYVPKSSTKFFGEQQTTYPCKNWSSFMVFNNAQCRNLTPYVVNTFTGLALHRFFWLRSVRPQRGHLVEDELTKIGSLPLTWNWLVSEYPANSEAKNLHFTLGGPWWRDYQHVDHADLWHAELQDMCKGMPMAVGV